MCFTGVRREEDMKVREKAQENLRIKGAFGAQELYDKHRGWWYHGDVVITMEMCAYDLTSQCWLDLFLFALVSITSGYSESDVFYNPMLWYDRPQAGMKRSAHQAALDAYSMMADSCSYYNHLQPPAVKYMKHEPVTYYQYAEEPDRYHSNLAASTQTSQVPQPMSSASLSNYNHTHYASYSTAAAVAAAAAAAYGSLPSDSCNLYSLGQHVNQQHPPVQVASATEPQAVSPARPAQVEESSTITAPLTPPLSVSPVMGHVGGDSPAPPRSMAANSNSIGYMDKEPNYGSSTGSPCERADCDSTTQLLAEGEMIPKLPLHVLSDLSEGLPLPGECPAANITQGLHLPCLLSLPHSLAGNDSESSNSYIPATSGVLTQGN